MRSSLMPAGACLAAAALAAGACLAATARFADDFDSYASLDQVASAWDLSEGWQLHDGALTVQDRDQALAVAFACPELSQGEIRAAVTPRGRARPGCWSAAGVMLHLGPDHYWRVALVEAPTGERYCELVERYAGLWQAQVTGRTTLPSEQGASEPWEYGERYALRIAFDADAITGEVRTAAGEVIFSHAYRFGPRAAAVKSGRAALEAVAMNAAFDDVVAAGESAAAERDPDRGPAAAVLLQPGGEEIARLAAQALERAGVSVTTLDPSALGDAQSFNRGRFDLLVLPRAEAVPGPGLENLLAFLRAGGHLLAFGGPPFETTLWPSRGEWSSAESILAQLRADRTVISFDRANLSQWTRASNDPASAADAEIAAGPQGRAALQVRVADLSGWDTLASPALESPFGEDFAITTFWAKGGPHTEHLVVEWNEADGSRWMTAVGLSQEWRHYALRPQDFQFWPDSPARDRGGPGDGFDPARAQHVVFGLAQSHAPLPDGEHTYWVADIGVARSPFAAADPEPPTLESMSPWYKVYEVQVEEDMHHIALDPDQRWFPAQPFAVSGRVVSPVWRFRGLGPGAGQRGRWVPLLRVTTRGGDYRGAAAWTYFATSGPYRGATWTCIGLDEQATVAAWERLEPVVAGLGQRLSQGLLLAGGGAAQFSYFADGQPPRLVARVANIGPRPAQAQVRLSVVDRAGEVVFAHAAAVEVVAGAVSSVTAECPALPAGRYRAVCEVWSADSISAPQPQPLDRISHEFSVIAPSRGGADLQSALPFITVRNGDFYLGDEKWYPHGLNFWPAYVAGLERFDYWLHWLSPSQYDPEAVERDLGILESLGVNMVSIQYGAPDQAPALNDFLERARDHGIHVNIFLPGAHPLVLDERLVESLVTAARLAASEAVFAYDLAWEPVMGNEPVRRRHDEQWAAWIEERYGSIAAAERDWDYPLRRMDGKPTGPSDDQLVNDGPHRRMVAAYRRFADDLISQGYGRITRLLRRLDPNHLFGARTGYGGTGQPGVVRVMAFDMVSGAAHLDFASPEGWGLHGPWPNFERAGFTTAYGRWASGGKPVFWSEFGDTIYPGTTPERYPRQAEVYRNLYRMALQSGASGSAGWWYPGGLRVDENSDFGVINPDGTPRPAAEVTREFAPAITTPRPPAQPDTWIAIDRDQHVSGYAGIWQAHADEYLAAVRAGKTVGLRTEADGMTSADAPLVAVGSTPYNGANPPRYLNAEFGEVRVMDALNPEGAVVGDGAEIEVAAGAPVRLRVEVINTGVATFMAPTTTGGQPGGVYVAAGERGGLEARSALPRDVPRYGRVHFEFTLTAGVTRATEVTLAMLAEGRAWFGQRLRFTLAPRAASPAGNAR